MTKIYVFPEPLPPQEKAEKEESDILQNLSLDQLYHRLKKNQRNIEIMRQWLDDLCLNNMQDPLLYKYWVESTHLNKKLKRAIFWKRLKNYLFPLVLHNQ